MKTRVLTSLWVIVLTLFLSLNSCKESLQPLQVDAPTASPRTEEIHPLQKLAPELYEPINDRYDDYGKLIYHHFKFNPVNDPIEYMPKEQRAAYLNALAKVHQDYADLPIQGRIDKLLKDGLINQNIHSLYTNYFDKLSQAVEANGSAVELWKFLRASEKELVARPNDEGIGNLLAFSSMMRNHLKYRWEVEEFGKMTNPESQARKASFCLFGITGSCWLSVIVQTVFDAATAGLAGGIKNALDDKSFFAGLTGAGYAGAAVSFIKNTVSAYTNSSCGCGAQSTYTCVQPDGFRLLVDGCSQSHYFQVIGGGADATNFSYSVQNGTLPEFGNVSSVSFTGAKTVKVSQNNPNTPILVTVTAACSNGTTPAYSNSYDLYAIERNPEPISLNGPVNIDINDPSQWTYTASSGDEIANKNNTLIWSRNWAGQTVGGGNNNDNYIKIKWVYRASGSTPGKVYLQSQNQCSGAQAVRDLSVNIY